ncbi:MAG: polysaccharide biosynthesis C-terminal domain-containing protein [Taibaiella sp.]|nr:polysaccharide biosynthesis C-terminal domain-containing protein [Taibaiella sp.]
MKLLQRAENSNTVIGNSFLIFLIRFFPSLAALIVVIVFSRYTSEELYGSYQNFWVRLYLLSALATLGIPAFLLTYTPEFIRYLFTTLRSGHYIAIMLWMIAVAASFAFLHHATAGMHVYIAFLFFLLHCLNVISETLLIVARKFSLLLWVNLLYTAAFLLLHYGVLTGAYSVESLFLYLLLPIGLKLLVTGISSASFTKTQTSPAAQKYTKTDIRSLWLHIGIYDVLQRVFTWIDKFIISILFTAGVSAMYFNGTYDIPFLPLLLGAVSSAALLQLASGEKKDDNPSAILVANQTARILSAVVFPLFFFLFLFREELFHVLLTIKYADSIPIFAVTVFIVPLRAYNFTSILQNRHKGRIINIGALLDLLVACALMYPLYQWLGLTGIALSFVISSYIQGVYYLHHTARVLNTKVYNIIPLVNWSVKLIAFGLLFIIIHYLLDSLFSDAIVLFLGSLVLVVTLLVSLAIEFKASKKTYGRSVSQK